MMSDADVDQPVLSVVLPNFNHGSLIPQALEALLAQERPADEIIVLDDGSTDHSREIIAAFAQKHGTIRELHNERNIGALRTLQRGLEAARGRYVYFAAADDMVLPGFFSGALALLEKHPQAGLCCCDALLFDGTNGQSLGKRPIVAPLMREGYLPPDGVRDLLKRADNFILTGSSLLRRDLAAELGGFDASVGSFADGLLVRRIALSDGLCYRPQAAAHWNIYLEGLSRSTVLNKASNDFMLNAVPALLEADPLMPSWYPALFQRRWRFNSARLLIEDTGISPEALLAVAAPTAFDRIAIKSLLAVPGAHLGRLAMLSWLTVRFRPYRVRDVLSTALLRRRLGAGRK